MLDVTIDEIQRDPLKYLHQVEAGETLIIVRANKAIAELRPISSSQQPRPFGLCKGEFTVPDDFDDPLSEELLGTFEVNFN
jgi:antitoxin (DNA-binding transcriptional repressor) of toxin-antitoxin stability system